MLKHLLSDFTIKKKKRKCMVQSEPPSVPLLITTLFKHKVTVRMSRTTQQTRKHD